MSPKRKSFRSRGSKSLALRRFILGFFFAISFVTFGFFDPWNDYNDPKKRWGEDVVLNHKRLLEIVDAVKDKDGEVYAAEPWSNSIYPKIEGGYAARFYDIVRNHEKRESEYTNYRDDGATHSDIKFKYSELLGKKSLSYGLYSNDELLDLKRETLKNLSPAEKLDIINGRSLNPRSSSYYKKLNEVRDDVEDDVDDPVNSWWTGSCHSMAIASVNHPQPESRDLPIQLKDSRGNWHDLILPLTSSDIEAFVMMAYEDKLAATKPGEFPVLDGKCKDWKKIEDEDERELFRMYCKAMNAGAFHVVLLNQIAKRRKAFVADMDKKIPVWNRAVYGFKINSYHWYSRERNDGSIEYLKSDGASEDTWRELVFNVSVYYIKHTDVHENALSRSEMKHADIDTDQNGNHRSLYKERELEYNVEIDRDYNILGGTWAANQDYPDYFWIFPKIDPAQGQFRGDFKFLNDLVK